MSGGQGTESGIPELPYRVILAGSRLRRAECPLPIWASEGTMMRAMPVAAIIVSLILSASASAAPCDGFVDVDDGNAVYCSAVTFVKNKGVTLGCTDSSHYCPNDNVTRLQMALFLQRMGKGGPNNTLGGYTTTIGGGDFNSASDIYSTVGGGSLNIASGAFSTIGGGYSNIAKGQLSTVAGGYNNTASAYASTVVGGYNNTASAVSSFVAGYKAVAVADGEFVWADQSSFSAFEPSTAGSPAHGWADATNTFNVRATGGVWFVTGLLADGQPGTGPYVVPGSGAWSATSDRAVKENFRAIDPRDVLAKVSAMPITSWNYITEGAHSRHLGPVSQDFHSAFLLGSDDKSITSIDEAGVALAAIQGLYQIVQEKEAQVDVQRQRIVALEDRLAEVEALRAELAALRSTLAALGLDRSTVAATSN